MINVQIQQQFGRLGLDITPFNLDLKVSPPNLELKQTPAEISIDRTQPELTIDYTPARESIGYYAITKFMKLFAEQGMSAALEGIARRVNEGDALGHIEKGIPISQVAHEGYKSREVEVQIASIAPIQINYEPGTMNWSVAEGGVDVSLQRGSLNTTFQYGKVKAYLEQEPSLQIKTLGNVFDKKK